MENLAFVRPFAGHGGPGYFSVRFGSNDPPHFAQHEQVQLAGWREKSPQQHRRKTRPCQRLFLPKSPELCQHRQVLLETQHLRFFIDLLFHHLRQEG